MRKVWIEAALNGPWTRAWQPSIPDTVEAIVTEGIACASAGATIIHAHAYDGAGAFDFAARHKLHTTFAIYEPGFARAGAPLARAAGAPTPIYRLMFCEGLAVGFPPRPYALDA
jgi:hypothetical protein